MFVNIPKGRLRSLMEIEFVDLVNECRNNYSKFCVWHTVYRLYFGVSPVSRNFLFGFDFTRHAITCEQWELRVENLVLKIN